MPHSSTPCDTPPESSSPSVPEDSGASTPSNAMYFTPRRAMASFENLVALANHQERLKEAQKMVWRVRGEPVVELPDLEACLKHASLGGFRSTTLAFNIRATFNLILAFIRIRRVPKNQRLAILGHAIFGSDTWRFAAMLGTFTLVYKFLINALPLLFPPAKSKYNSQDGECDGPEHTTLEVNGDHHRRSARLSLSAHAQQVIVRKKTRRWHAALAGAVAGGLAVLFEKRGRRITIGQQLFVRGLQGSFNAFTARRNISIPHGDIILFSLVYVLTQRPLSRSYLFHRSAQVLYASFVRPDSLPAGYRAWIIRASQVPPEAVRINYEMMHTHTFNTGEDLDKILTSPKWKITPQNAESLLSKKQDFFLHSPDASRYLPTAHCPCAALHPGQTSCLKEMPIQRFLDVAWFMLPVYGALHFLPPILFRTTTFMRDPTRMLLKALMGTAKSCTFLGVYVVIYQASICARSNFHEFFSTLPVTSWMHLPQWFVDFLFVSRASYWIPGVATGLSMFAEEKKRRAELAMYVLPKALESLWNITTGKVGGIRAGKPGEALLAALGMAMVMSTYQNDPQRLSGLVRRILYQFIGPN
ncbi:hypothetical protein BDZ89DRAFT_322661 [Hymenopellis radicata]|nr:hypothetical protein BDZ89DRAFT_322661 [Hymenopellis radicata]